MRKVNPNGVRADFNENAAAIIQHFDRLDSAIARTDTREGDLSQLATQSFLALFVAFERFTSDLLLAYLNRDSSKCQSELAARVDQSTRAKFGDGVGTRVVFQARQHLALSDLEAIVDPTGWNLTFNTVAKLKQYASDFLVPSFATRVNTISGPEARLIDTARAIRDFIAHQSSASKTHMNACLSSVEAGTHNRYLGRAGNQVNSVGAYLKSVHAGRRRLHRYATGLLAISVHI